jgi:hypothetical protein
MKQFNILFLLLIPIYSASISTWNINNKLRNTTLRLIVFKENKIQKLLQPINRIYRIYYDKLIASLSDATDFYNNLNDDDKLLIDAFLGLFY